MANFYFTAFEKTGEILFNEVWEFENEQQAKTEGEKRIAGLGVQDKTHRLVNSKGKIILFHS